MQVLQQKLDSGNPFPFPDGLLINGLPHSAKFTGARGYRPLLNFSQIHYLFVRSDFATLYNYIIVCILSYKNFKVLRVCIY